MALRPNLHSFAKAASLSKPFPFLQFRTLLRNAASTTPFLSDVSALFPMQRRGGTSSRSATVQGSLEVGPLFSTRHSSPATRHLSLNSCICHTSEESHVSLIIATHPKMASRKSFACHTYDTPRGRGAILPIQLASRISRFAFRVSHFKFRVSHFGFRPSRRHNARDPRA